MVEAAACGMRLAVSELGGLKAWFGEDMTESGNALMVKLPRMVSVDKPLKEDESDYAGRFAEVLIEQMDSNLLPTDSEIRKDFVKRKSWESVFESIESHIPKI